MTAGEDPSAAIVAAAEAEKADVLVVGNLGMSGRKEFLLGNVPNRVSHNARCTVVIVNTAEEPKQRSVEPQVTETELAGGQLTARAARIAPIVAKHGLRQPARTTPPGPPGCARRSRSSARPSAKLGQILSTRPDLIPPEVAEELAHLQDDVPPLTEAEVVQVMEEELGVPWEDVFESIEPEPLAAGTIGQVHRARLEGGDRVVIKVQRPDAAEEIERDLGLFALFAEKAEGREALSGLIDIPAVVEHLASSLRRELDFREEASNIERMREVLEPYPRLARPRRADAALDEAAARDGRDLRAGRCATPPRATQRREAAQQMLESFYRQVLTEGFFHADPHPGNLLWADDRIYLLDLGMVGTLDEETRKPPAPAAARVLARGLRLPRRRPADARRDARRRRHRVAPRRPGAGSSGTSRSTRSTTSSSARCSTR